MMQLIRHSRILHDKAVIVHVSVLREPRVPPGERIEVERHGHGLFAVNLRYGFMQGFNIPSDLALCIEQGELPIDLEDATYIVGRTSVIADRKSNGMMAWRDRLFAFMLRNTMHATSLYRIPSGRVVEMTKCSSEPSTPKAMSLKVLASSRSSSSAWATAVWKSTSHIVGASLL